MPRVDFKNAVESPSKLSRCQPSRRNNKSLISTQRPSGRASSGGCQVNQLPTEQYSTVHTWHGSQKSSQGPPPPAIPEASSSWRRRVEEILPPLFSLKESASKKRRCNLIEPHTSTDGAGRTRILVLIGCAIMADVSLTITADDIDRHPCLRGRVVREKRWIATRMRAVCCVL